MSDVRQLRESASSLDFFIGKHNVRFTVLSRFALGIRVSWATLAAYGVGRCLVTSLLGCQVSWSAFSGGGREVVESRHEDHEITSTNFILYYSIVNCTVFFIV